MIELKNITKKFDDYVAVDDLSIKIGQGEVVGFLGPNGAGKTTTMRIISGFFTPDSGEVIVENINAQNEPIESKSRIGYMPENNPLYKDLSVKDSLNFILELHKVPLEEREKRVKEAVKSTGIANVYYRTISELSKGYKQRVGIAQVLLQNPKILILDEPTEGLDPNQRKEIRQLIKKLGKEKTVIISTHVMQEVEAMCSRIVIINKGKIIADGDKESILSNSQTDRLVEIRVKTKNKITKDDFNSIKSKSVKISQEASNISRITILTKDDEVFEKITKKIKEQDWILYSLNQKSQNLEEIFQKVTK